MGERQTALVGDRSVRQRRSDDAMVLVAPPVSNPNGCENDIGAIMPLQECEVDRFGVEDQGK